MSQQALTPYEKFVGFLDNSRATFKKVLPSDSDTGVWFTALINYIKQNPALLRCSEKSLATAAMRAARVGLLVDKQLGHAHILPFKGVATYVTGYPGLIHLAKKYADASDVRARAVYENDEFDFVMGDEEKMTHRAYYLCGAKEPGKMIGCYAIIEYKDGFKRREFIPISEIETIKKQALARTKNSGPWADDYGKDRMAIKTAIFRLFKQIDANPQMKIAIRAAEQADAGDFDDEEELIKDADATETAPGTKSSSIASSVDRQEQPSGDVNVANDAGEEVSSRAPHEEQGWSPHDGDPNEDKRGQEPADASLKPVTANNKVFVRMMGNKRVEARPRDMSDTDLQDAKEAAKAALADRDLKPQEDKYYRSVLDVLDAEIAKRGK